MRVAILARFSTLDQTSADRQIAAARKLAAERGWEIDEDLVVTLNFSSSEPAHIVSGDALVSAAKAGQIDAVIIENMSRLSRGIVEVAALADRLTGVGAAVIALPGGGPTDEDARSRRLMENVAAYLRDLEREQHSERTRAGIHAARARRAAASTPEGGK